jgi:hypothetical protein
MWALYYSTRGSTLRPKESRSPRVTIRLLFQNSSRMVTRGDLDSFF